MEKRDKDFWSNVRNFVSAAIIDLELFLDTSDETQVQQVITGNKLKRLIA